MTKNKRISKAVLCMALWVGIVSLASAQTNEKQVLRHVVAFTFKEDVSKEQQAQAIQLFSELKDKIPEIKKFEGGVDMSVEGRTKGLTHCFILTFDSEADRDIYLPHPAHMHVVEKNKPLMSDLLVLDVWGNE